MDQREQISCAERSRRRVGQMTRGMVMADPGQVEERAGTLVVVTPCDCRSEVVLDRAQARASRWQACPACERRWLLYVLGSGRVV